MVIFDPNRPWKEQTIDTLPPLDEAGTPFLPNSWSPDGRHLAGSTGLLGQGIATYSIQKRTYERLTDYGEWPVWLSDSRRILFVAGGKSFFVIDGQSKAVQRVYSVTNDVIGPPRLDRNGMTYYSRRVTEGDVWTATLK